MQYRTEYIKKNIKWKKFIKNVKKIVKIWIILLKYKYLKISSRSLTIWFKIKIFKQCKKYKLSYIKKL